MLRRSLLPAAGAIALAALLSACSKPAPAPEAVRSVRILTVAPASAGGTQDYAAEIRARTEVRLAFRVGGKMASRNAEVGQRVKAGDVLARLDPQDLQLSRQAAAAAVRAAQVSHELNLADYKRFKDLRDQGFISSAELDRREAALKGAAATLEQARAQASVQGNQAAYTTLVATAPGIVVAVEAEPGAVLAAGTPVLRLALDGPRDVVFAVPEDALAGLRAWVGKPGAVSVRLWGSDERLTATVRELAAAADPVTRTFQVKADLQAASPVQVQLGRTATASIELPPVAGVALLPLTAIKEHQGGSAVWVLDAAKQVVRTRPVRLGGAQGNQVIVLAGLQPGEQVVTAGVHVLTEGQAVKPAAAASAAASAPAAAASR
ncbi:MAG: efflux RND transporter periplasmic adaptor subunit [Proteobacteria bacterium]|nr:efflux RND transporter periplasmic adaptor subunit [Pseudomonadota bacterium]MCA0324236.1 efflux RND transporter periplasmic adaptor subunit [Pseudomonadota bacterium]